MAIRVRTYAMCDKKGTNKHVMRHICHQTTGKPWELWFTACWWVHTSPFNATRGFPGEGPALNKYHVNS